MAATTTITTMAAVITIRSLLDMGPVCSIWLECISSQPFIFPPGTLKQNVADDPHEDNPSLPSEAEPTRTES